jgi:ABC-type polysaccharide/polyol phosphate transport system ATPase subunit
VSDRDPILALDGVTKIYPIFRTPLDLVRPHHRDRVVALDDVSLELSRGEVIGIIGRNGAGKSTLLRLAAGIATPTAGSVVRRGTVYPLLELSAGLSPFLSARENARQKLRMVGFRKTEIEDLVDGVIDFAELWDVADEPVHGYSTGMKIRLAFSIVTAFQPEVLLVDEVLAVGDEFFAAKSFRRIEEMVRGGRAALVASHNWLQTFRLCTRIVWLEQGRIKAEGTPPELMNDYLADLNAFELNKHVRIGSLEFIGTDGSETRSLATGDSLTIRFSWESDERAERFALVSGWTDAQNGESVLSAWSGDDGYYVDASAGGGIAEIHYPQVPLSPGRYDYWVCLADPAQGPFPVDYYDLWGPVTGRETQILIEGSNDERALVALDVSWRLEAA